MMGMAEVPGSARASRAADDAFVVGTGGGEDSIALVSADAPGEFGEGAEPEMRGACTPPETNYSMILARHPHDASLNSRFRNSFSRRSRDGEFQILSANRLLFEASSRRLLLFNRLLNGSSSNAPLIISAVVMGSGTETTSN